jgi:hypothetical protein
LAGWLLNVGRPSEVAAEGEEVGEGAVVVGEGVDGAGAVCGFGVLAGVADRVALGAGAFSGDDDWLGLGAGVGEFAAWPPVGSPDFCSQPMTSKLAKAMGTTIRVFMPIIPTHQRYCYSRRGVRRGNHRAKCLMTGYVSGHPPDRGLTAAVKIRNLAISSLPARCY